jgi:hypothetical protein
MKRAVGCKAYLAESVFQASNARKDLAESNQAVRHSLDPHVDGSNARDVVVHDLVDELSWASRCPIDIVLDDRGRDHRKRSDAETPCDSLNGSEVDFRLAERRIDEEVHDWDEDDQGEGVQIVDQVVWHAVQLHGGRLRCEVVRHLVVGDCDDTVSTYDLFE